MKRKKKNDGTHADKKLWEIVFPELTLKKRIYIYLTALVCAALSFTEIALSLFSMPIAIAVYCMAAVSVTYSCYYLVVNLKHTVDEKIVPAIMENTYTRVFVTEYRTRTVVTMCLGLGINVAFALWNAVLGITMQSAWLGTMAAYYMLLCLMRMTAVKREWTVRQIVDAQEREAKEQELYMRNSDCFVGMALVLAGAVVLLELAQGGKQYPGLTIYAAAAYSFYKIIMSTIQVIKVRKRNSPLLDIIRRIGYIDASVSILTLQTAMFASFATEMEQDLIKTMNGITGTAVCLIVLFMGIQGIYVGKRWKRKGEGRNDKDTGSRG